MILVDVNLLIYAEDDLCEQHTAARTWWDTTAKWHRNRVSGLGSCHGVYPDRAPIHAPAWQPLTMAEAVTRVGKVG